MEEQKYKIKITYIFIVSVGNILNNHSVNNFLTLRSFVLELLGWNYAHCECELFMQWVSRKSWKQKSLKQTKAVVWRHKRLLRILLHGFRKGVAAASSLEPAERFLFPSAGRLPAWIFFVKANTPLSQKAQSEFLVSGQTSVKYRSWHSYWLHHRLSYMSVSFVWSFTVSYFPFLPVKEACASGSDKSVGQKRASLFLDSPSQFDVLGL